MTTATMPPASRSTGYTNPWGEPTPPLFEQQRITALEIGPLETRRTGLVPGSTIILARDADAERTIRLARITAISPGSCDAGRCTTLLECEWFRGRTTDNAADDPLIPAAPPSDTAEYWQSRTTS